VRQRRAYSGAARDTRAPPPRPPPHRAPSPPPPAEVEPWRWSASRVLGTGVVAKYRRTEALGAMSLHAARGGAHEDLSWSALGRRAPGDVMVVDRGGWGGVGTRSRAPQGGPAGEVRVDKASCASTFRELDDAFLQVSAQSFSV
jgi:hypothetical protein